MHHSGEITYYEELGVAQNASADEIRDAFRSLVRLMHPDQQTDEQLKKIAELQMRKLNRIYGVLSDADRRRRYDDILEEAPSVPTIVFRPNAEVNVQRLMARFAWVGAALIVILILVWLAAENPVATVQGVDRPAPQHPAAGAAGAATGDSQSEMLQLRSELSATRAERDAAVRELARLRGPSARTNSASAPAESSPAPQPSATTLTELPAAPLRYSPLPNVALPTARSSASVRTFAGFWFYTRPVQGQHNKNSSLYPPEFIEATLTEQSGVVHGRYRSRYQIVDRAISPDVNFEFTGTPNGSTIACPWSGPGGSRGELTMKMSGENTMEVEWTANELGSVQGLVSGTAHLTRRVE